MKHVVQRVTVTIAAGALLAVGLAAAPATAAVAAEPTELFISEYVEGSSNNKAIEIYNPTGASVDLSQYTLRQYSNGNTTTSVNQVLSGTLAAGETFVFAHSLANAAILAAADLTANLGLWNGDDAIVLDKAGSVVDSLGQIGLDPGTEWGTGLTSTADNTLRRLASVCVGDTDPTDVFDPALEWEGFAQDTFDGLGSHTCGEVGPQPTVINEFSASTAGTDVEFVELLAEPGTDLTGLRVLEIEGDFSAGAPTSRGLVDEVVSFDAPDADGRALVWLPANALENGTVSLLLVSGYTGATGVDLDTNDDGTLDLPAGVTLLDAIAVNDGGSGDLAYGGVVLTNGYDGIAFVPGAASRIPDGTDTDSTADWVRNDFDLAGIPGNTGTLVNGEAANTPGVRNSRTVVIVPLPPADCNAPAVTIGSVQGAGAASPVIGAKVEIEGVVTGDFQAGGGFDGYYLQDAGDADAATSDGIFVFAPTGLDVAAGDVVHVAGTVSEFFGMTEVTATANAICDAGAALPGATEISLPVSSPEVYESLEGMIVTLPQSLAILETFEYARYGTIDIGVDRQMTPTAVVEPGSPEFDALEAKNLAERITIDDGRFAQNPDPAIHPNGDEFTLENSFRGGDLVSNVTGVLDHRRDGTDNSTIRWRVQPTEGADFEAVNLRADNGVPEVGGTTKVASFNVLNYFTTLDSRGANTPEEFERQEAKIVSAIAEIDADVVGLIEIENNGDEAVGTLVEALNDEMGAGTYDFISTGVLGTDVITTALIYKPAEVAPTGDHAVLTELEDPRFNTDLNRPALAQTFTDLEAGGEVTVVVNHLKSKGSPCAGDPDLGDGAGNCNVTRTLAAQALADWLAGDPTGQGAGNEIIMGDLNSYDKEDPIDELLAAGYTDLLFEDQGEEAYSYVFDGQLGYLDYALTGAGLTERVTGAAAWHVNSDEPNIIDYDMTFKLPAQDALFAPDQWRSSDHDPVIVGLDLDVIAPELTVTASPDVIFPPNAQWRTVDIDVEATDNVDADVTIELVSATAEGHKADIRVISDTQVEVLARQGAVYTVVYTATDDAGNATTESVTIRVGP
ncbi:ExeM/NucH family extracellular endonuclease [Agromyces sp. SYSU K20354]|uniref:ExeM/NucH family extracellular endonuclease n=1 Tax=Agromyces cavernae TaxID=2898659 RepID=UPI001E51EBEC|nr:ExeM/NucH family extracellular endonuclease [Agromyces cavernae]MCD2441031.1 ExeM/NucH family extracellular endonuclease [Agromyces cavernae]